MYVNKKTSLSQLNFQIYILHCAQCYILQSTSLICVIADGLSECSTQFYQVIQTTTVTLSDQSPVPQSETDDEQEETQAIAGVDDLLDTLNQLIIEPITKKNTYQKYGRSYQ